MIHHRFMIGSIISIAAVIGCGGKPVSQAPTPAQSPSQSGIGAPSSAKPSTSPFVAMGGTMAGCPGGNGIHISATGGNGTVTNSATRSPSSDSATRASLADSASGFNQFIGLDQSVDTTWVFNISQRTWTRTNLAAAISVGLADETRGRYAICAGVAALIPNATLTLQGVRGRVHFAASLKQLSDALRLGPGR
jgi:hypothetical protein